MKKNISVALSATFLALMLTTVTGCGSNLGNDTTTKTIETDSTVEKQEGKEEQWHVGDTIEHVKLTYITKISDSEIEFGKYTSDGNVVYYKYKPMSGKVIVLPSSNTKIKIISIQEDDNMMTVKVLD